MNFISSRGRRRVTGLALGGLLLGGLLLGGCGRQPHAESPASDRPAAGAHASANRDADDVDSLLNEVDKQLNADDQPAEDQD
jgi:hypothetical protein